jgi:hypothetical protein
MVSATLILAGLLFGLQNAAAKTGTAADRVVLRDGSVVLGLVTNVASGPHGGLEMLVRREWANTNVKPWAMKWERANGSVARMATVERRQRLQNWRWERGKSAPADDRILTWIDQELKRLADPAQATRSRLISIRLSRGDVRTLERQAQSSSRLLKLGWMCELVDVERMSLDNLKEAIEGRGFALDGNQTPSLAALLPPARESDIQWQARRAATELTVDSDLRFLRYQGMVVPDLKLGQPLPRLDLAGALGEITKLLDPGQGDADPLFASLTRVGERGRVGAMVTRLDIQPDLSQVSVEATLWVRAGNNRWVPYGSRSSTIRPDDLAVQAGQNLAADPQVQTAFSLVEALGLGAIPPALKQRSLRVGAATEKALGMARSALNQDLEALALPVSETRVVPPVKAH